MPFRRSRRRLLPWLLAGALLISGGLNVYCLAPHDTSPLAGWWVNEPWDDDDDSAATDDYTRPPAQLADELRHTRQLLRQCRQAHGCSRTPAAGAGAARPSRP